LQSPIAEGSECDRPQQHSSRDMQWRPVEEQSPSAMTEDPSELANRKITKVFTKMESQGGALSLEKESVYGAAVAMPQIARSAGWSKTLTILAVRSMAFMVLNTVLQAYCVYMIYDSGVHLNMYSGQPHLCDFGARMQNCPDGPNCDGPGGTKFDPSRLYGFDVWQTRTYVRDALIDLFPDKAGDIKDMVDPGEYGLESYFCRLVCVFLFCCAVTSDLRTTIELVQLLYTVPSKNESWLDYAQEDDNGQTGYHELDAVRFNIKGMPLRWKIFNFCFVAVPKFLLWTRVSYIGVYFLMETSSISDLIVNTTALSFLLGIDEMLFSNLTTETLRTVMRELRDYEPPEKIDSRTAEEYMKDEEWSWLDFKFYWSIVPPSLVMVTVSFAIWVFDYYHGHCNSRGDGSMYSRDVYVPRSFWYNPLCVFMRCDSEEGDARAWHMKFDN